MDSWLHIMLICAALLVALQGTDGSERHQKLKANVKILQEHYDTFGTKWVGKAVFAHHLEHLGSRRSCTCRSMMLDGMLNVYEKIFTNILNSKEELKSSARYLLSEVENLRRQYHEERKTWRDLQNIHSVKEKDSIIRGTSLNEFLMVFNEANKTVPTGNIKKIQA